MNELLKRYKVKYTKGEGGGYGCFGLNNNIYHNNKSFIYF